MALVKVNRGWGAQAIPYEIDNVSLTQAELQILNNAINDWNSSAPMRLVLRTDERDYLIFRKHTTSCNSLVGRQGGRQEVLCDITNFQAGSILHEICHAMGLYHEHQRADRNNYITLSAASARDDNYRIQESHDVAAIGNYDLGSIMHYSPGMNNNNFTVDVTVPPGVIVGQRNGLSNGDLQGLNWLRRDFIQESGRLKQVSVSADGFVWGVNEDEKIYFKAIGDRSWVQVSGALTNVSVGNRNNVWGVNRNGNIYRRIFTSNPANDSWRRIRGELKNISVGNDGTVWGGTVWGVNSDNNIYRWNGTSWDQIQGRLKQISVGNQNLIWGVNSDDKIYRWNGASWDTIGGSLACVSIAADGTVWGVNSDHKIFLRNATNSWSRVSGSLAQIDVGSFSFVYGVNRSDQIYSYKI